MNSLFIQYLIESSAYAIGFGLLYKILLSRHTHFPWMRAYLMASLALCLILPFLKISLILDTLILNGTILQKPVLLLNGDPEAAHASTSLIPGTIQGLDGNNLNIIFTLLKVIYLAGVLYFAGLFIRNISTIFTGIRRNPKHNEGKYRIVTTSGDIPAYSFFNYIFINKNTGELSAVERQQVKRHADQYHSLDMLLLEFAGILLWFNPVIKYYRRALQDVHEFVVDEAMVNRSMLKNDYSRLLLSLAGEAKPLSLSAGFTEKQIGRRILMIGKERSLSRCKLLFVLIVPLAAILLFSFSILDRDVTDHVPASQAHSEANSIIQDDMTVGKINWEGNTIFSTGRLDDITGLKTGDIYDREDLHRRIWKDMDGPATLYFDRGYVFFIAEIKEEVSNNVVDITVSIYEGIRVKIGDIIIKRNVTERSEENIEKIKIGPGDWFSKTRIVESVNALEATGKFVPGKIIPTPVPVENKTGSDYAVVNLEFAVTEKK